MKCDPHPTPPDRLRLRTASDLLAVVPYLIGFHPADSLVLVGFADRVVRFVARVDLPDLDDAGAVRYLAEVANRQAIDNAALVGYGPDVLVDPTMRELRIAVEQTGLAVRDALRVTEDRYWSYLCQDPACCPPDGTPFQIDTSPVAASAVMAGCVALPDRESLERQLAPVTGAEREAMTAARAEAEQRLHTILEAADPAVAGADLITIAGRSLDEAVCRYAKGESLDDAAAAWLLVLLSVPQCADLAWQRVQPGSGSPHVALWHDLTRRAGPRQLPPVATLLGYAAWQSGNGVLAGIAVQRARSVDDTYEPAEVMETLLSVGVPPPGTTRGEADPDAGQGSSQ